MSSRLTTTAKSARVWIPLALLGVLAVVFGVHAATSAGAPSVPAPTITAAPANPTNETSATFRFSSGLLTPLTGLTYQCSLDGSVFATCTSPKSYSSLAVGSHTFRVRAKRSGDLSSEAAHTWVIDVTAPPPPQITAKPTSLSSDTSPSFSFTDAEAGVSFRCKLDSQLQQDCSSPHSYSIGTQGSHTFSVVAVDAAGNASAATAYTWALDSTPPPKPRISAAPDRVTKASSATFAFTDAESAVTFECRRDGGAWSVCASPVTYLHLVAGDHEFAVRAVDAAGNRGNEDSYGWRITLEQSRSFAIGGDLVGLLYPGAPARPVAVKLTNPSGDPIYVTSLQMTVTGSTSSGCDPATNLAVTQAPVSQDAYVLVPADGSVTLPAQGVAAPSIRLLNLPVNQNACRNATFSLSYGGSAHS
jgi:hypothetical protein